MFGFAMEVAAVTAKERQVSRKQERADFTACIFTIGQDHSFREFLGKQQRDAAYMGPFARLLFTTVREIEYCAQ